MQAAETAAHTIAVALVRLRALVLALGETNKPAWWRTEFMNETGLRFLERLYPRSVLQAALHAAGKSSCEIHDQAIGRSGVYHLYRLPGNLESAIRDCLVADGFLGELRPFSGDSEKLVHALTEMGGSVAKPAPGDVDRTVLKAVED